MAEQPEVACGVTGQQWGHDATRILWLSLWTINMVRRFESVFMIQTFILYSSSVVSQARPLWPGHSHVAGSEVDISMVSCFDTDRSSTVASSAIGGLGRSGSIGNLPVHVCRGTLHPPQIRCGENRTAYQSVTGSGSWREPDPLLVSALSLLQPSSPSVPLTSPFVASFLPPAPTPDLLSLVLFCPCFKGAIRPDPGFLLLRFSHQSWVRSLVSHSLVNELLRQLAFRESVSSGCR